MTIEEIIREELEALKARITANMQAAGQIVTGKTAGSMAVETSEDGGSLTADRHFPVVEVGSKPWRVQYKSAPKFFAEIIGEWLKNKGLSLNPYAVATTIMREGSRLYREGGREDIYSNEIEECLSRIEDRIGALAELDVLETLVRYDNK